MSLSGAGLAAGSLPLRDSDTSGAEAHAACEDDEADHRYDCGDVETEELCPDTTTKQDDGLFV